jgi:hypothetical protein
MIELDRYSVKTASALNDRIQAHVNSGGKLTPLEEEFWGKLNDKLDRRTPRSKRAVNE